MDMSTPVTRGELRDELAHLENRLERKLDDKFDLQERKLDDKFDLQERKLDDKLELQERRLDDKLDRLERRLDDKLGLWGAALAAQIAESEKRVLNELARHTQAVFDSMATQVSALDEKYRDLPARVTRLEVEIDALK